MTFTSCFPLPVLTSYSNAIFSCVVSTCLLLKEKHLLQRVLNKESILPLTAKRFLAGGMEIFCVGMLFICRSACKFTHVYIFIKSNIRGHMQK